MAELTQKEKLQPSLLDRLADGEPHAKRESRDKRILSLRQLRESVQRDLGWLMNCANLSYRDDLDDYPEVKNSVLNYGIPDLTGHATVSLDVRELEKRIKQAVSDFEPRILSHTLKVSLHVDDQAMHNRAMTFDVEGELWAQPVPLQIYLKTELDLEIGSVKVTDLS